MLEVNTLFDPFAQAYWFEAVYDLLLLHDKLTFFLIDPTKHGASLYSDYTITTSVFSKLLITSFLLFPTA